MKCPECGNPRFKLLPNLGRFKVGQCPKSGCGKTYYRIGGF